MSAAALDFDDARGRMVDSQIRPNKVSDPRILAAMRTLPRERFLPPCLRVRAYLDEDVPLGGGRVLIEPLVLARLIQLAAPVGGERTLVVAAGSGYGAAILAACGANVVALEEDPSLAARAREVLPTLTSRVQVVTGPLGQGWAAEAPFDVILIEGAVREVPPVLAEQLRADGGRLVTVCVERGTTGKGILAEQTAFGLRAQPVFDCATPLIPSLLPRPGFVF